MPLFWGSDSAVELWESDAQDASSQSLGSSSCILREESSTPQSAGGASRVGLDATESTALLPGVEASPESTGEELLDLEEVGAPPDLGGVTSGLIRSWLSSKALGSTRPK